MARRVRLTGLITALMACAVLCVPAVASATDFSWSQPGDFTASGSGSNPEHKYGEPSWSYSPSVFDGSFAGDGGTYAGWVDSSSSPSTWIGVKSGGTTLQMVPASGGSVTLTWTSPFATTESVTVSGSVDEPNYGSLPCLTGGTSWTLTNETSNTTVASGSAASSATISSQSVPVGPGDALELTVSDASLTYSASCDDTEVGLTLTAPAPASAVTLTDPTANQTFTAGQPTYAGAAGTGFGYDTGVTVKVYSGSTVSEQSLVQTLTTTESGGSWSTSGNPLQNGTYTAEAQQNDVLGNTDSSSAVTFTVDNPPAPTVTLNSLGSAPLKTSTPTLTGTAGTASGDSVVGVVVSNTGTGKPVTFDTAAVGANGDFSVQVSPALPDGQYSAVAYQQNSGQDLGSSSPMIFSIKIHAPVVTLATPAAGSSLGQHAETFSGVAGDVYGDSHTVTVTLWRGTSATGKPLGTVSAPVSGATWSVRWPTKLALGLYTVRAAQTDDAGHTTTTGAHTFLIVPSSTPVGDSVTITRSGEVSVPISCPSAAGTTCKAAILVLTAKSYQPTKGGVKGQLRVLFAYLNIPGGETVVVRQRVTGAVERLLLKKVPLAVRVVAAISSAGGKPVTSSGTRTLKLVK